MTVATPDEPVIEVTDAPDAGDAEAILSGLVAFNAAAVGPSARRTLAVVLRQADGACAGGLAGHTAWGWLCIEKLWIAEGLRGKGLAARLLHAAEAEATARGCQGAWIDTFNPAALALYRRQGYAVFGELPDFPQGRTRSFLRKTLPARS